ALARARGPAPKPLKPSRQPEIPATVRSNSTEGRMVRRVEPERRWKRGGEYGPGVANVVRCSSSEVGGGVERVSYSGYFT
nr:hypothetical protein [Gemmatimonadota bacterium]